MSAGECQSEVDLTVITVCHNSMATLPHCVGAVQQLMLQGELRVQYLVVDIDSDDGTQAYLAAERDRWHISDYTSESFSNEFAAMNRGLELACGKVCVFIRPEDEMMVENTAACCAPILRGEVGAVFSSTLMVDPISGQAEPRNPNTDHLFLRTPCRLPSFFCSTELMRRLGGFDGAVYPALADCDLMHRVLGSGEEHRVVLLSTCRHYLQPDEDKPEALHLDFLRFIVAHRTEILQQCCEHPAYAIRTIHEIQRHTVRCTWPLEQSILDGLEKLLYELRVNVKPVVLRKICRRLRRRALVQGALILFRGMERARVTLKLCRGNFYVARLLSDR